ncbi:hypothetical protein ABZZ36_33605 [Actinacidiphila glaucinigra]|uniref:hypothetical protein n=1 Tax=Actinacidiphila glaucinigra TaxID=235986 RepID=UPI0033BBD929
MSREISSASFFAAGVTCTMDPHPFAGWERQDLAQHPDLIDRLCLGYAFEHARVMSVPFA